MERNYLRREAALLAVHEAIQEEYRSLVTNLNNLRTTLVMGTVVRHGVISPLTQRQIASRLTEADRLERKLTDREISWALPIYMQAS